MHYDEILMNFSGLYSEEAFMPEKAECLDLRDIEGTNCYCSDEAASEIRDRIKRFSPYGLHWIDTGDYHYSSLFWLEKITEPFTLFLFDNHPDDQDTAFGTDILSCGNWVKYARNLPGVIDFFHLTGTSASFKDGNQTGTAYLSIDLDVLSGEFARTDWDQGDMTLEELKQSIMMIAERYNIIGADICGGITGMKGGCGQDVNINVRTSEEIRDLLLNLKSL